ncbi:MAG TPA: hypothetical protein VN667_11315 [Burkholderiales bacterium]|nr:hypothetical protein [Burkholderiales bacterium]
MRKPISRTTKPAAKVRRGAPRSVSYEEGLIGQLKNQDQAAAYIEAAIAEGDQTVLTLARHHVAKAQAKTN